MTIQRLSIYRKDNVYLFCPSSKTTSGVWLDHEPGFGLAISAPPAIFGRTLMLALSLSGPTIPHPTDWKAHTMPLLAFTGAKGWRGFCSTGISHVAIELIDSKFQIQPWLYDGKGFEGSGISPIELPSSATPDELAHAVIKSFQGV
jgi:hypothetical protein